MTTKKAELEKIASDALEWCKKYNQPSVNIYASTNSEKYYYSAFTDPDRKDHIRIYRFQPKGKAASEATPTA